MVHNNHMSKNIHDASWAKFASMLSYKAVTCGGRVKEVDPRNTSRICSKCGTMLNMPLKKREFRCSKCGLVCHRDLNAAVNIKGRAGLARTNKPVNKRSLHLTTQSDASRLNEAGTIRWFAIPQIRYQLEASGFNRRRMSHIGITSLKVLVDWYYIEK